MNNIFVWGEKWAVITFLWVYTKKKTQACKRFLLTYDLWWINEMKPYNNSQIYELNFTLVRWRWFSLIFFFMEECCYWMYIFLSLLCLYLNKCVVEARESVKINFWWSFKFTVFHLSFVKNGKDYVFGGF